MNTLDPEKQGDRLRRAPAERFAGNAHDFDLAELLAKLRAEDHRGTDGHRQITLLRRASAAHVLFAFEPGGKLDRHHADGEVSIHVLEGRLSVTADGRDYSLGAGHVLMLSAGVPHDVRASETSAMLLTVFMAKDD
ncbi:MAG: cupin domain-containing protein [Longimicrobiales bacterium]